MTSTYYIVFVRPPGSHVWTIAMKDCSTGARIPNLFMNAEAADEYAVQVCEESEYCTCVGKITLPKEQDKIQSARFSDADTVYFSNGFAENA